MRRFFIPLILVLAIPAMLLLTSCNHDCDNPGDEVVLAKLEGDWIRVESNNPTADFVKINVVNNTGTITDKASSNFKVGDIKWRSILVATQTTFTYEELGSDYNYYEATITLVSDNELTISIAHSGAGNSQKWVRDNGSIGSDKPTLLDCKYFSQDRTLTNTASGVDYIIPCVMDITKNVTIEPGVVIEFEENAGFGVYDNGSLNMTGTSAEPIILRGKNQTKGYWRGVHLETNSSNNRFEYVEISDAGSNYVYCCNEKASVFLKDGKTVIKNCTIQNGKGYGLFMGFSAEAPDFQNNTITTHDLAPIKLGLSQAQYLDATSTLTGNTVAFVEVRDQDVTTATTVPRLTIPYLAEGKVIDITAALSMDAGVELVFEENGGLGVYDNGSISLNGTSGQEVRLRGKQATPGYWRGIHIETQSINNQIVFAHISDAGGNYVYCCNEKATIFLKGNGKLKLQNTRLEQGESFGLYASTTAELIEYGNNTITSHTQTPLYLAMERVGELDGEGSTYSGNQEDFIGIFNSNAASPLTWPKAKVPYLVDGFVIDVTEALTISPGTEIVFEANGGLGVYDNGSINAVGSGGEKIIFRGKNNVSGYWRGIHVETNSLANEFKHLELRNAGSNYVYCCNDKAGLILKGGRMKVTSSFIGDNAGCGIFVKSGATLEESGNTFSNNINGHICN